MDNTQRLKLDDLDGTVCTRCGCGQSLCRKKTAHLTMSLISDRKPPLEYARQCTVSSPHSSVIWTIVNMPCYCCRRRYVTFNLQFYSNDRLIVYHP